MDSSCRNSSPHESSIALMDGSTLSAVKDVVDIAVKIVGLPAALGAAYLAYRRWFRPATIGLALDSVVFVPPGSEPDIKSRHILIAAQLRFFNAGAFPESLTEISLFDLTVTMNDDRTTFAAYAFLKPLNERLPQAIEDQRTDKDHEGPDQKHRPEGT